MAEFFDWNSDRGTWYEFEFDHQTGLTTVATKQDVKPVIDHAQRMRDSGYSDRGMKKGWWRYATIPAHVELELRKKGINIYKKEHTNRLLKEIDQNYPKLKYTYKTHRVSN
jgi:hypothetical protein